jgi:putative copper export protein/mono/diheme cytochrome c family protein
MNESAILIARWMHQGGGLLLVGSLGFLVIAAPDGQNGQTPLLQWRRRVLGFSLAVGMLALLCGGAVFAAQLVSLPQTGMREDEVVRRLLFDSRFGTVWLIREGLLLASSLLLIVTLTLSSRPVSFPVLAAALGLACGALVAVPFAGHSAAQPAWPTLAAHCTHLLAAGLWLGALPVITDAVTLVARGKADAYPPVLAGVERFSALALPLMAAIVASGVWIAVTHVGSFPALFGTTYGYLLIAKILLLLLVLAMAASVRRRFLPRFARDAGSARRLARWVLLEWIIALALVLVAVQLARTVPAAHDAIEWPLPFRLSIDANANTIWIPTSLACLAVATTALGFSALRLFRVRHFSASACVGLLIFAGSTVAGLAAVSVDAYPDTYRRATVPYQTISVASGELLFQRHCISCHGSSGHGNGPAASMLPILPANLTDPHTSLHTAGDIFWWLTHGKPPGVMPGFANALSEDDRWDVVNFLRTLSAGYQARILRERVVPQQPWLSAIDFNFADQHGEFGTLRDFRGQHAVLLVLFTPGASSARMLQLAGETETLLAAGAHIVALPVGPGPAAVGSLPFPVAMEGATETVHAYSLLRRTLTDADTSDRHPVSSHMELLVDRFGYVRARWLPMDNDGWRDLDLLRKQIELLAREGQIRPPPEDHVH